MPPVKPCRVVSVNDGSVPGFDDMKKAQGKNEDRANAPVPGQTDSRRTAILGRKGVRHLLLILPILLVIGIYQASVHGPFILDDVSNIAENEHIMLRELSLQGLWDAGFKSVCSRRPLANISFALNYYFHGFDVSGYHLVNILIHLVSGILLYLFLTATIDIIRRRSGEAVLPGESGSFVAAFLAAAVWMVHPLHTESVSYIVQRMASMSGMFYIMCILMYVWGRSTRKPVLKWGLYAGCIASGAMSAASKEIAATLPFFILLYEWYFFRNLDREWIKRVMRVTIPVIGIAAVIFLVFYGSRFVDYVLSGYAYREFTLGQRVLTEFRVVIHYISLLIFPHPSRLNLDYDFFISHSLFNPATTLFSAGAIVFLIASAVWVARRDRLLSFAILWFFGNLVIESTVFGLELVFEHRTYLPSMLIIPVIVFSVLRYIRPQWAALALLCASIAVLSFWTYERNELWADDELLWQDCVRKSPGKPRAYNNYGHALARKGRHEEAISEYFKALDFQEKRYAIEAHGNLGISYLKLGMPDEAIKHLSVVQEMSPNDAKSRYYLGEAYEKKGMYEQAAEHYQHALEVNPRMLAAHYRLAEVLGEQGLFHKAAGQYRKVIHADPGNPVHYLRLGNLLGRAGMYRDAIENYHEALRLEPNLPEAETSLGAALFHEGYTDDAILHFHKALKVDHDHLQARYNLGIAFIEQGRLIEAMEQFQAITMIDPDHGEARKYLEAAGARKEKIDLALSELGAGLAGDPDNARLHMKMADLYRAQGEFENALAHYDHVLAREPENIGALHGTAVLYSMFGRYDKALSVLGTIRSLRPDDPDVYYNTACIYSRQKKVREAAEWLARAVDKGFDNWSLIRQDKDLEPIRSTDYYQNLIKDK